ncbi:DeoR/GlpR family DNA-binding transcription regulator [Cytobacillus firmus]|uniref:DeoR family transcriptional regulator n=1 Tax=Cytobacillus firmus DS1 TaxID=1307436 RepID=W7KUZ3_CYTFI|nr:DeoR/GlpR family DNA-binding transcription regulator [Cytobacillus firmus]EWG10008.1 DeoR family transcriptional regulator [Cytobacillus firmus DS1]
MLQDERTERIVQYINKQGFVKTNELIDLFKVSKPTIIRDLLKLEKDGSIIRTHGGAKSIHKGTNFEPTHMTKEQTSYSEKESIAIKAKELVQPGETILLDSGTTTLMLAKQLVNFENITVITNDIKIAMCLSENDSIDLVVLGGQRRKGVYSLIGPLTESILNQLHVDKVFLGADAIDLQNGITNSNIDESNIKKTMLTIGNSIILLADSSKFNCAAFMKIDEVSAVHFIITDNGIHKKISVKQFKEQGVEILIAE